MSLKKSRFILVFFFIISAFSFAQNKTEEFTGFLADVACGTRGRGLDGSNLLTAPEKHTRHCLEVCAAGGYGISIKGGKTYEFTPFDERGSELAKDLLANSGSNFGFKISVTGYLEDGVLIVTDITEM